MRIAKQEKLKILSIQIMIIRIMTVKRLSIVNFLRNTQTIRPSKKS